MEVAKTFHTGVLVIGGGAAAMRAALAACDAGASTTVVLKGRTGRSGATVSPDSPGVAWQVADDCVDGDSPEQHARNIIDAGLGMADPRLASILADEVVDRTRELEQWGLKFIPDPAGRRAHYAGYSCFGDFPRAHGIANSGYGHAGDVVRVLVSQLKQRAVDIHQDVFIVDLLVEEGQCVGAWGLGREGEVLVYRAGAVVLAAGGARQIFPPEPERTPIDTTGDGYAMGLRAGAELANMEFTQFMLHPIPPFPLSVPGVYWALCPELKNCHGEDALAPYLPPGVSREEVMRRRTEHYPFSTRDVSQWLDIAFAHELRSGRGTEAGGLYLDFSKVDLSQFRPSRPQHMPDDPSRAVSLPDHWVQVRPAAHAINGGIWIDERAESTVPGLFAVAEAATGPHGADRLGGGMVSGGQVFAARAGRFAAERAADHGTGTGRPLGGGRDDRHTRLSEPSLWHRRRRQSTSDDTPDTILSALQEVTGRHLMVLRNDRGLETLLGAIRELRETRLPRVRASAPSERRRILEVENSLMTAELMALATRQRTESRGAHFREDHPRQDANGGSLIVFRQSGAKLHQERRLLEQPEAPDSDMGVDKLAVPDVPTQ